jgi:hypothetical protein
MSICVSQIMSRRDLRTQPGVLTPGANPKMLRPHKAFMIDCLVRAGRSLDMFQGLKPLAKSLGPFGTIN